MLEDCVLGYEVGWLCHGREVMLLTNQLVEDVSTGGVVTTVLHHSQVQLVPRNLLSLHMLEEGLSPTLSTPIHY